MVTFRGHLFGERIAEAVPCSSHHTWARDTLQALDWVPGLLYRTVTPFPWAIHVFLAWENISRLCK